MRISILILSCLLISSIGFSQDVINLINPSFEGVQRGNSVPPAHWYNCGFLGETPPDMQPGYWKVNLPAQDGGHYLGMVVRMKDTWEAVGQPLVKNLQAGKCYEMSVFLARSDIYESGVGSGSTQLYNFFTPTVLRIYAGTTLCDRTQLLAESKAIDHDYWVEYHFKLDVTKTSNFIVLEAYYKTPVLAPYNGHMLVDNVSAIKEIPCDKDVIMVRNDKPTKDEKIVKTAPVTKAPVKQVSNPKPKNVKSDTTPPAILKELNVNKLKKGSRIELKTLYFAPDSVKIEEPSEPVLNELASFLHKNKDVEIEVGGHTNGLPQEAYCKYISEKRAKSVASYLIDKGISPTRITTKGYGKTKPIADDKTKEGRARNQRVEIQITEIKGK